MENNEKQNTQNIDPYKVYITKVFRVIPQNAVLLTRNKFNGNWIKVKTGGFALISPFSESKLVSLAVRNFDYEKQEFEDRNGLDLTVDLAVTVKIVDPIRYEYKNKNVEAELKQLIDSLMRSLIKKCIYEELSAARIELPSTSIDIGRNNEKIPKSPKEQLHVIKRSSYPKTFSGELLRIRDGLDQFAKRYGLVVIDLYTKSIQQSAAMQEAYNKQVIAKKERAAALIAKEGEKERAMIDAEIAKIKAGTDAYAIAQRYKSVIERIKNLPRDKQAEILKVFSATLNGNPNMFMSLDGGNLTNAGMVGSAVMGQKSNGNNSPKKK